MAKKQSKHSRAARRNADEIKPEIEIDDVDSDSNDRSNDRSSGRTKVLEEIALKELRQKGDDRYKSTPAIPQDMDELTAISLGLHPELAKGAGADPAGGRVGKASAKKNRRNKVKQQRAEMVKDMLNEKIELARQRHKTVRTYRKNEDEEDEKEE